MRWSITTARAAATAPSMSDDRTAVAEKCAGHPTWTEGGDAPDDAAADAATPPIAMAAHKSPLRTPGAYPRRRDSRTRQTRGRFKTGRAPITELRGRAAAPVRRRPCTRLYCLAGPGCDSGAGPSGSPPGPPANVSHGIDGWKPTGGLLQSQTPSGNACCRLAHCAVVNGTE